MITITSPSFDHNGWVPSANTCDGRDVNPPLEFSNVPENTMSLALIVDDPDSPNRTWTHWLVWNIDPTVRAIGEESVPAAAVLGRNDFGRQMWGGPCPQGGVHHYHFKIFALDTVLSLPAGSARLQLEEAMNTHILDQGELVGQYERVLDSPAG